MVAILSMVLKHGATVSEFRLFWIQLIQATVRKSEKDSCTKDETDEGRIKKDEASDTEDEEGMRRKEEAESVEVRDVTYNLELLAYTLEPFQTHSNTG